MPTRSTRCILAGCLLSHSLSILGATAAWAQGLSDPTRPPSGFYAGPGTARAGETGSALVLQSVLIYPDMRSAIISGEHVVLGQKVGTARLVRVAETEVVLLDGAERRTLRLFPGIDKRPAGAARAVADEEGKP
jgi:MSHA biogenesis protein MshK